MEKTQLKQSAISFIGHLKICNGLLLDLTKIDEIIKLQAQLQLKEYNNFGELSVTLQGLYSNYPHLWNLSNS